MSLGRNINSGGRQQGKWLLREYISWKFVHSGDVAESGDMSLKFLAD